MKPIVAVQLKLGLSAKRTIMPSAANDRFEPFPTDAAFVTNGQNADLTDLRCGHEKSEFAETKAVKMGGKQSFARAAMRSGNFRQS